MPNLDAVEEEGLALVTEEVVKGETPVELAQKLGDAAALDPNENLFVLVVLVAGTAVAVEGTTLEASLDPKENSGGVEEEGTRLVEEAFVLKENKLVMLALLAGVIVEGTTLEATVDLNENTLALLVAKG